MCRIAYAALRAALKLTAGGCVTGAVNARPSVAGPAAPPPVPAPERTAGAKDLPPSANGTAPVNPPAENGIPPSIPAAGEAEAVVGMAEKPAEPPKPVTASPKPGQPWTSPATGMEFLWVDSLKIWIGKYEVTNAEYRRMKPEHYSEVYLGVSLNGNRQPVVYVNFYGARVFAEWMTDCDRVSGHLSGEFRYRLPSRSEWLAFAQCGDGREYPWGGQMPPRYGNYADLAAMLSFPKWSGIGGYNDGSPASCAVENSGMNDWGLYGVGGNVWEATASDSSGRFFGAWHGASWRHDSEDDLMCLHESVRDAASLESDFGFRLVMVGGAQ